MDIMKSERVEEVERAFIPLQAENEGFRSDRANSASRGGGKNMGGGMDMMAEMARKLAARSVP